MSSHVIQVLPDLLVNQIAAGEVVERPASVLKELVENALDAKATQIDIELREAGLQSLRIRDNGVGITPQDLPRAIARHATSKIRHSEDLAAIATFGFRGEALAAIASVSSLTLQSRAAPEPFGFCLKARGQETMPIHEVGMAVGTDIEVADLFFNVPARKKFLRKEVTEKGHLEEVFIRAALFSEGVGFSLTFDGKLHSQIAASANVRSRIQTLLAPKDQLLEVNEDAMAQSAIRVHGFLSAPQSQFGHRERYYLFCNGRPIRDRLLSHAITQAYREVTPYGQFPLVVLNLTLPFHLFDINVHPAKTEVRFKEPQALHHLLFSTVRKALQEKPSDTRSAFVPQSASGSTAYLHRPLGTHLSLVQETNVTALPLGHFAYPQAAPSDGIQEKIFAQGFFSALRVLGQWQSTYILCEDPLHESNELILIDQHAAAERIGYERLKGLYKHKSLTKQYLLLEETFEVSNLEMGLLLDFLPQFEDLGFEVYCDLDKHEVRIIAIPAILKKESLGQMLKLLLNDLAAVGRSGAVEEAIDLFLMTLSCHTTVRANHHLEREEMQALLDQLDQIDFSQKCPHGRPVAIAFNRQEIEERFARR